MFCAEDSLARQESMAGTASICQRWVLLEHRSAWGPRTLLDASFDEPVAVALRAWAGEHDVRLVLIKQPERSDDGPLSVFMAAAGEHDRVVEHLEIDRPSDLLDLDLSASREEGGWGLGTAWVDPLYLVCTHGRRDPCCAIQGNPVFNVLHEAFPTQVWKSTHVGGDRFAANLVSLPSGIMLGRLRIDTAIRTVREMEQGTIALEHYRGRCFYPFFLQAAEHHLRVERAIEGVDALRCLEWTRDGDRGRAVFELHGGESRCTVELRQGRTEEPRLLTCHSLEPGRPPEYALISIS